MPPKAKAKARAESPSPAKAKAKAKKGAKTGKEKGGKEKDEEGGAPGDKGSAKEGASSPADGASVQFEAQKPAPVEEAPVQLDGGGTYTTDHLASLRRQHERDLSELKRKQAEELMKLEVAVERKAQEQYNERVKELLDALEKQQAGALKSANDEAADNAREAEELRQAVTEEKRNRRMLIAKHEGSIAQLKMQLQTETAKARAQALAEAENSMSQLQNDSRGTLEQARRDRHQAFSQSLLASQMAEVASFKFEEEISARTKELVEEYRRQAKQASDSAAEERQEMWMQMMELEQNLEEQRNEFERQVTDEVERRIALHRSEAERAEAELQEQKERYEVLIAEMLRQVEKDCRSFEEATKRKALGLVEEHRREVDQIEKESEREREEWILRELHWVSVLKRRGLSEGPGDLDEDIESPRGGGGGFGGGPGVLRDSGADQGRGRFVPNLDFSEVDASLLSEASKGGRLKGDLLRS